MKTFIAYLLGFSSLIIIWWLVSLLFVGIIPAILSLLVGASVGNKVVEVITGTKPKDIKLFNDKT